VPSVRSKRGDLGTAMLEIHCFFVDRNMESVLPADAPVKDSEKYHNPHHRPAVIHIHPRDGLRWREG
jgi:hypothetical protein